MKEQYKILIISSLMTVILLISFSVMQLLNSRILELDNKWLFVSGIPILIGLFLSGIIKSFKGFGVELESNLSEKISFEMVDTVEVFPSLEITKKSIELFEQISEEAKTKIKRLQFELGKQQYYEDFAVQYYISNLKKLQYIEIIDGNEKFMGLLTAEKFIVSDENAQVSRENIEKLISCIEKENIRVEFRNLITDKIKKEDTLLKAYRKFKQSEQGRLSNGDQVLPVVDSNNKMIGVTKRIKLTDKIVEQVLNSQDKE